MKLWIMKVSLIPIIVGYLGTNQKNPENRVQELDVRQRNVTF